LHRNHSVRKVSNNMGSDQQVRTTPYVGQRRTVSDTFSMTF